MITITDLNGETLCWQSAGDGGISREPARVIALRRKRAVNPRRTRPGSSASRKSRFASWDPAAAGNRPSPVLQSGGLRIQSIEDVQHRCRTTVVAQRGMPSLAERNLQESLWVEI